jgi:hypothetical protein
MNKFLYMASEELRSQSVTDKQRSLLCPSVGGASEDKNIQATDNIE